MSSANEALDVIELVLKELESVWASARGAHGEDPENAFNAGRYEGLTQAIAVVENIVARGRYRKNMEEDPTEIEPERLIPGPTDQGPGLRVY